MFLKDLFCARLREERLALRLTQEQLGEKMHLSKQSVSRWEKGDREPNLEALGRLSDLYLVSVDYLMGQTNKRDRR